MSESGLLKLNKKGSKRWNWLQTIDTLDMSIGLLHKFLFQLELDYNLDENSNLEYRYQCDKYSKK